MTATHAQNLLLFFIRNDSAITISSLLLPRDFARPATTIATNGNFSLQLIVESLSTGADYQVAPATILDDSFKLIDVLTSEGAMFAPYIFENASTRTNKSSKFAVASQAMVLSSTIGGKPNGSFKPQNLIVIYFKRSLHFREVCGIFCEGEWEQQRHLNRHTGLVNFIGLVGLIGFIDFVNFIGVVRLVGLNLLNGLIRIVGLSCLNDLIGLVSFADLVGIVSVIRLVDFISIIGLVDFVGA